MTIPSDLLFNTAENEGTIWSDRLQLLREFLPASPQTIALSVNNPKWNLGVNIESQTLPNKHQKKLNNLALVLRRDDL